MTDSKSPEIPEIPEQPSQERGQRPTVRRALAQGLRRTIGYVDNTFIHFDREVPPEQITVQKVADGLIKEVTHPMWERTGRQPDQFTFDETSVLDQQGYKGRYSNREALERARMGLRTLTDKQLLEMRQRDVPNRNGGIFEWRITDLDKLKKFTQNPNPDETK